MAFLSVVIVCKDEADIIGSTLQSLEGLTDDIVIFDNGSSDNTMEVAQQFQVKWHTGSWEGYGKTKKKAVALAQYDWVLNLDADEGIDEELKEFLIQLRPASEKIVFEMRFKNFLGKKPLKFGEWGNDWHIRLFNRKQVNWDESPVHEQLVMPAGVVIKRAKGNVLHHTVTDEREYAQKMQNYASLNAEKYHLQGKKSSWLKIHVAPAFNFFNFYVLKLGFLDGHAGYVCAKMTSRYTFLKYKRLKELWRSKS